MTVIALLLALSTPAHANKADGVQKLLDLNQHEAARKRCERSGATLSTAPRDLREVCARAFWEQAAREDTVAAWLRLRQAWGDTTVAKEAREQEARCALRDIGADADEARYQAFVHAYADTALAGRGDAMMAKAAIRSALEDPRQAKEVAKRFPAHEDLALLVERFPTQFLRLTVDGEDLKLTMDPPVKLAKPPTARWVAAFPGDAYVEWEQASIAHLLEIGLPRHWIDAARRGTGLPFVPCPVPGAEWTLGVLIEAGSSKTFVPQAGPESCRSHWPTFVVVRDGRVAAVGLDPQVLVEVGTPGTEGFQHREDGAAFWLLGNPSAPLLGRDHLMQSVGSGFLFTPLDGGLPWLEGATHAAGSLTLTPATLGTVGLPEGWTLEAGGKPLTPGAYAAGPVTVRSSTRPGVTWTLPPGEIRVLSTIVAHHTGLHRPLDSLQQEHHDRMPALGPQGPVGGMPMAVQPLGAADLKALSDQLWSHGVPLKLTRAWRASMRAAGQPQILFEGEVGRNPVRGVLDPSTTSAGWRVSAWKREGPPGDQELLSFVYQNVRYVAWRARSGWIEGVWFGQQGLTREVRLP